MRTFFDAAARADAEAVAALVTDELLVAADMPDVVRQVLDLTGIPETLPIDSEERRAS